MFRQKALDRLKSPEDLDNLLVIVNLKSWAMLLVLLFVCGLGITWSIFGRIPISVDGFGVLINPGNVKGIQSQASGQIVELQVRAGQEVKQGELIATVNQPDIQKQLDQKRAELATLEKFNKVAEGLDQARKKLVVESLQEQQRFIESEIAESRTLLSKLKQKSDDFTIRQQQNLKRTRELTLKLTTSLQRRLDTMKDLRKEGLSSDDLVLDAETKLMSNQTELANLDVQSQQVELKEIERERDEMERQNRLADLELELIKLKISQQELTQEITRNERNREQQRQALVDEIERLEISLREQSQIVSKFSGRILEISVSVGQVVGPGQRVGTIEVDDPDAELRNLAYFSVKDGKKVQPGDEIRITPATVERERYGSIVGKVTKVSSFPVTREGVVNVVGNAEIAEALMKQGGAIEIEATLEKDANSFSGYRWTSKGPELKLSSGTTTTVRVTVERRAPITYVLPLVRAWLTGQKDDRQPEF